MSSDAILTYDEGEEITLDQWAEFAAEYGFTYRPEVVGQNSYRHDSGIHARFGGDGYHPATGSTGRIDFSLCEPPGKAKKIVFTTTWSSPECPNVARLAVAAWQKFGGTLDADPEVRRYIQAKHA